MHVVFCTVPAMGHFMPLLPLVAEVLKRGHSVTFFHESSKKYRQTLEHYGLSSCKSVEYDVEGNKIMKWSDPLYEAIVCHFQNSGTTSAKPDVIVYDFFAVEGADAADKLGIPTIGVYPNPRSHNPWAATLEEQASLKWKVWCEAMWGVEAIFARIAWIVRTYQRWKRSLPMLSEQDMYPSPYMPRPLIGVTSPLLELPNMPEAPLFRMVGPSFVPPPENELKKKNNFEPDLQNWLDLQGDKPIVYIAFGTMHKLKKKSVQKLEQQLLCLGNDAAILWSLPEDQSSFLQHNHGSHQPSWKIVNFLDQIELLKSGKVKAFVTHCGSNSVCEALLSGVPMVCCPCFADQPANATRLVRKGLAIMARKMNGITDALRTILLEDKSFAQRSFEMAKVLESEKAAENGVDYIESIVKDSNICKSYGRVPWGATLLALLGATVACVLQIYVLSEKVHVHGA